MWMMCQNSAEEVPRAACSVLECTCVAMCSSGRAGKRGEQGECENPVTSWCDRIRSAASHAVVALVALNDKPKNGSLLISRPLPLLILKMKETWSPCHVPLPQ